MDAGIATGLSAGVFSYDQKWREGPIDYGFVTPLMASVILDYHYEKNLIFHLKFNQKI